MRFNETTMAQTTDVIKNYKLLGDIGNEFVPPEIIRKPLVLLVISGEIEVY